jgi:hypothetical protein
MEAEVVTPGVIIGDLGFHGPGVRFGVTLAPEPSERVRRILADTQPQPEMDEENSYARCDHCGDIFPLKQVQLYWCYVETLDDGRGIFTSGIYCSEPCGEWSANRGGSSRG